MSTPAATVLIVGLGSIGQRHARLLSEREDVALAFCDAVEEHREQTKAALSRPARAEYSDYATALRDRPDLVFVCTPNKWHAPMALAAMESGAGVFVEKPLADSVGAAQQIVDAARAQNRFLQVGYMLRLDDGLRRMKQMVESGDLGTLIGGRAMVGTYLTLMNARSDDREREPHSLVVDYTHEIDFIRWFFGDVAGVLSAGATIGDLEKRPQPNVFQMILQMQSGTLVQVHMDYVQLPQRRLFEIYGDRGTLCYDFMTGELRFYKSESGREHRFETLDVVPLLERWDDFFRAEHEAILSAWREESTPLVTGEDGLAALRVAAAAIEADHTQSRVALS